jgi:hypothetical protein
VSWIQDGARAVCRAAACQCPGSGCFAVWCARDHDLRSYHLSSRFIEIGLAFKLAWNALHSLDSQPLRARFFTTSPLGRCFAGMAPFKTGTPSRPTVLTEAAVLLAQHPECVSTRGLQCLASRFSPTSFANRTATTTICNASAVSGYSLDDQLRFEDVRAERRWMLFPACSDIADCPGNGVITTAGPLRSTAAGNYAPWADCFWVIQAPAGQRVLLTFPSFDVKGTANGASVFSSSGLDCTCVYVCTWSAWHRFFLLIPVRLQRGQ